MQLQFSPPCTFLHYPTFFPFYHWFKHMYISSYIDFDLMLDRLFSLRREKQPQVSLRGNPDGHPNQTANWIHNGQTREGGREEALDRASLPGWLAGRGNILLSSAVWRRSYFANYMFRAWSNMKCMKLIQQRVIVHFKIILFHIKGEE